MTATRRQLLTTIGLAAGSSVLFRAMEALGHTAGSTFGGPPALSGARPGSSVVVLGAGLAGLLAAYELRKAGYKVTVLEYQSRAGGRNWSIRGGDTVTELGGATQTCQFAPGNYLNPGPWRLPHGHRAIMHYCKQLGVPLEIFTNYNTETLVHSGTAFGGKPQRFRNVLLDFNGNVAELLSKAANASALDMPLTREDREKLLEAMRGWGVLDENFKYVRNGATAFHRGYDRQPGGGPDGAPVASTPLAFKDLLNPVMWGALGFATAFEFQPTMFQPVGGMDGISKAFMRQVKDLVTLNAKVTAIAQDTNGVTVTWTDTARKTVNTTKADWCVCAMPLTILGQTDVQVGKPMQNAIRALPYMSFLKMGIEMKRRFWEEDEAIYGGLSTTDMDIANIGYPQWGFHTDGPAIVLGAFARAESSLRMTGMTPAQRIELALAQGEILHPQYRKEFMNAFSVAWSRQPWILGCVARWNDDTRRDHYADLTAIDGRIVLAGDHASYIPGWQEGALLSSLSAITRLHEKALAA